MKYWDMGLFEGLRRRLSGTTADEGDYECRGCGSRFECQRQVCPECEGYRIERTEW